MTDLKWFRIEVDSAGKVLSCVAVGHAERPGHGWFYVQAANAKAAERAALNSYMRDVMRRRRAELDKAGKCRWCGRKADRGPKRCSICLVKDAEYGKRKNAKAAGRPVPVLDRKVAIAARRAEERDQVVAAAAPTVRLALLLEVQEAWTDLPTNGAFTQWLTSQIAAARGKKVA